MENEAIHLCAGTALRVWQLLRALWEPRLDQLVPLARSLDELHIRPARLEELAPCGLGAAQVGDAVRSCLERVCRRVRRASRQGASLREVPLSNPSFMCAIPFVVTAKPIDLLVGGPEQRQHRRAFKYHVHTGELSPDMFVQLGHDVYLETPLYALARAASAFDTIELTMLAFELRGTYQTGLFGPIESSRCLSLFDEADLREFVRTNSGSAVRGIKAVRPLLIGTIDRAGSVMEAACIILLCAPIAKGGYGLPKPMMNWRIDVPDTLGGLSGWSWVACDAFWPHARVAFEYDGSIHQGERSQRDVLRSNVLTVLGIPTVTITKSEFFNADAFDRAAHQVAKLLHHRLDGRRFGPAWLAARNDLRNRVTDILATGVHAGRNAQAELQKLAVDNAVDAFDEGDLWRMG